jgi:hypothetical protein
MTAVGDRLIRAAEPQHLDQLFEDDPVGDTAPVTRPELSQPDRQMGHRCTGFPAVTLGYDHGYRPPPPVDRFLTSATIWP